MAAAAWEITATWRHIPPLPTITAVPESRGWSNKRFGEPDFWEYHFPSVRNGVAVRGLRAVLLRAAACRSLEPGRSTGCRLLVVVDGDEAFRALPDRQGEPGHA